MAADLSSVYRKYIQAIRDRDLDAIDGFVDTDVVHNKTYLGLQKYKELLQNNIISTKVDISIKRLVSTSDCVAAILIFTTKPETKSLVGIELDGVPFSYEENVFYDFKGGKIIEVHSQFDIDLVRQHARGSV